jgi:aminopeptidase N
VHFIYFILGFFLVSACQSPIKSRTPSSSPLETMAPYLGNTEIDVLDYNINAEVKEMPAYKIYFRTNLQLMTLTETHHIKLHIESSYLKVESVKIGQQDVSFKILSGIGNRYGLSGDVLNIDLKTKSKEQQKYTVSISYTVSPTVHFNDKGIYNFSADSSSEDHLLITRSWPYYARYWLPSNDTPNDTATVSMNLSVPDGYLATANGFLVQGSEQQGTGLQSNQLRLFQWKQNVPTTTYNFVFAVGRFDVFKEDICFKKDNKWDDKTVDCAVADVKIPMVAYYNKYSFEAQRFIEQSKKASRSAVYFSKVLDPYIFEKIGFVHVPSYPFAMESTSMIVIDHPESAVHEIAHHWWGDSVHIKHWGDFWISEGFTTYFDGLYDEYLTGTNTSNLSDSRENLNHGEKTDPNTIFNSVPYDKGAAALDSLRKVYHKITEKYFRDQKIKSNSFKASTKSFLLLCRSLYLKHRQAELSTPEFIQFVKLNSEKHLKSEKVKVDTQSLQEALDQWAKEYFVQ